MAVSQGGLFVRLMNECGDVCLVPNPSWFSFAKLVTGNNAAVGIGGRQPECLNYAVMS
jgi:hypothetical protein